MLSVEGVRCSELCIAKHAFFINAKVSSFVISLQLLHTRLSVVQSVKAGLDCLPGVSIAVRASNPITDWIKSSLMILKLIAVTRISGKRLCALCERPLEVTRDVNTGSLGCPVMKFGCICFGGI